MTTNDVEFEANCRIAHDFRIQFNWANMGAVKYYVEYRLANDSAAWKRDSTVNPTYTIKNLTACKAYVVRIAAACSNGVSPFTTFGFATIGCPSPCIPPVELYSEIVSDTAVSLKFNIVSGQSYTVQYRLAGTATWTSVAVAVTTPNNLPVRVTGLSKCTTYQWRVLRNCTGTSVAESPIATFITKGCPTPCTAFPRDLIVTTSAADSAKLTWIMPTAGLTYEVRYGGILDSSFLTATPVRLTTNVFVMRGLVNCRYYAVQIRAICASGIASEWVTKSFRMGTACFGSGELAANGNGNTTFVTDFGVYPNPGTEAIQVAYKLAQDANIKIELMNLQGQVVNRIDGGNQEVGNYSQTLDKLGNLNTGLYMVVISANGKVVNTQKRPITK